MSPNGGPAGNIYLKSSLTPSSEYSIDGNNVLLLKTIKLTQALLGGIIEVKTPLGTTINLKLPAGTKSKAKMRVAKHGIPEIKGNGCGDLLVVINIDIPKKLTAKQKEIIEQLEKTGL
jgi:curved DNA-binding protein